MFRFSGKKERRVLGIVRTTSVTSPMDKVQEVTWLPEPVNVRIEHLGNLVLCLAVDFDWRWRRLNPIRD
jgi:hypothetical protein